MKRTFVTGGTGFVGSRLVARLLENGHEIVLLTRDPRRVLGDIADRCRIVRGDVCRPDEYRLALKGCTAVVHAAKADDSSPAARADRDVQGSMLLFKSTAIAGVRRFVYLSSIVAYDSQSTGTINETSPRTDSRDPYAQSKVRIESGLLAAHTEGPEVVILQPGNIYGPGVGWWGTGQVNLMRRGKVIVPAMGAGAANLVFVEDLVRAIVRSIETVGIAGETFLVTDGGVCTWKEYYVGLEEIVGHASALFVTADEACRMSRACMDRSPGARFRRLLSRAVLRKPVVFPLSPGAIMRFSSTAKYSNRKACEKLSLAPMVSLEEGLESLREYVRRSEARIQSRS